MRKEDFNNALNYIDYDLVEEYVNAKESAQRKIARQRQIMRYAPVAACLVIILSISAFILPTYFANKQITNDIEGQNPETQIEPPTTNLPGNFKPGDAIIPGYPVYIFTFEYNEKGYIKVFYPTITDENMEFFKFHSLSEQYKGKYIGIVIVTDYHNNTQFECPIYEYAGVFTSSMNDKGIVVELFDGYYFYFSTKIDTNLGEE